MKYLKTNESVAGINKLQSYCENNLSYLLDNGFMIRVNMNRGNFYKNENDYYVINISMIDSHGDYNPFKWEDVMYDIIPFIIQLDKEFIIKPLRRDGILEINPVNPLDEDIFYSMEQLTDVNNEFKEVNNELIYSLRIHISKQSTKLRYLRK